MKYKVIVNSVLIKKFKYEKGFVFNVENKHKHIKPEIEALLKRKHVELVKPAKKGE